MLLSALTGWLCEWRRLQRPGEQRHPAGYRGPSADLFVGVVCLHFYVYYVSLKNARWSGLALNSPMFEASLCRVGKSIGAHHGGDPPIARLRLSLDGVNTVHRPVP